MRQIVSRKCVHEGAVDALGLEDIEYLTEIRCLLFLIANVLAVQTHGSGAIPYDERAFDQRVPCPVGCAAVCRTPELGDRHRLPLRATVCDESADVVAEIRGGFAGPICGISR